MAALIKPLKNRPPLTSSVSTKAVLWSAATLLLGLFIWLGLPATLRVLGLHPAYHGPLHSFAGKRALVITTSHAVLGDKGLGRLLESPIVELFATNSVPQAQGQKVTPLDISPLLAKAIVRIHGNESVTSLFDIHD